MSRLSTSKKEVFVCTDEKLLRRESKTPMLCDEKCMEVVKLLLDTYNKYNGRIQGLAAIQIWQPYRIILVRYKKGKEPEVLICPVVLDTIGSKKSLEGCESEPGKLYWVRRPLLAKVCYYTTDKKYVEKWITYKKARIFCHEVDHLDGILLKDKGEKVRDEYTNYLSKK